MLGEGESLNVESLKNRICQSCLDKIIGALGGPAVLDKSEKICDLCLIDFQTLEIYPLQCSDRGFIIRDYYIDISISEDQIEVTAIYAPGKNYNYKNMENAQNTQNIGKTD